MFNDMERISEALQFIPASDRDEWVKAGMAIKSEVGDSGFDLWETWSQQDQSFDPKAARGVWKSIKAGGKVGIGSLFHDAKAHGWRDDNTHQKPTAEEIAERRRMAAERAAQEQVKTASENAEAKRKSLLVWQAATEAKADHPYLARKQVSPVATLREIDASAAAAILGYAPKSNSELLTGRLLVIPVKVGSAISTLELIDGEGHKTAVYGGAKAGGYWAAQPLPDCDGPEPLVIGEGAATTLSGKDASGHLSIAALSSGNLAAVALAMRGMYATRPLIVLADLVRATGVPDTHAIEAAQSVAGLLAIPDFGNDRPDGATDFNDMAQLCGKEAVQRAVADAKAPASAELQVGDEGAASGDCAMPLSSEIAVAVSPIPGDDHRPCFRVFDDWLVLPDRRKLKPGVWFFGIKAGKADTPPAPFQQFVCSPIKIEAVTFDGQENNFGRLLRIKNTLGRSREWAMPMELLRGAGDDLRGELLAMGVEIDPAARNLLSQYLQTAPPKRKVNCALQVGWCGESFVLPDTVIGANASGVIFQSGERGHDEHTLGGTLAGWQSGISALAVGNPLLMLGLSASFAGPLLLRCNGESGGVHYVGDSSTGKTTVIEASCATWGGAGFRRSWRATANGMEGAAALFNDCLLALDEISECDPKEVGAIVYALGNGRGKQRASRSGGARSVTRWRCFVLSSGERTIGTTMLEGGQRAKAGQAVRLLDIPAARTFGAWDDLHGMVSGTAFSDAIKRASVTHHGHAGRAFLEKLTRDKRDFCDYLEQFKALSDFASADTEGQTKRAAARFALIALAGEVATEYGVTGWPEGAAIDAAAVCLKSWLSTRSSGNDERRQILGRVSSFIERHGDSRFSNAVATTNDDPIRINNRAGWWRDANEGREYLFTADGLHEALKGFDFKRALDTLQEVGALAAPGADGKRAKFYRIGGRGVKLYPISANQLGGDHGA